MTRISSPRTAGMAFGTIAVLPLLPELGHAQSGAPQPKPALAGQRYINMEVLKDLPADQLMLVLHRYNESLGVTCSAWCVRKRRSANEADSTRDDTDDGKDEPDAEGAAGKGDVIHVPSWSGRAFEAASRGLRGIGDPDKAYAALDPRQGSERLLSIVRVPAEIQARPHSVSRQKA